MAKKTIHGRIRDSEDQLLFCKAHCILGYERAFVEAVAVQYRDGQNCVKNTWRPRDGTVVYDAAMSRELRWATAMAMRTSKN